MGVSTVEAHLSRIYRKLGLRSRTELAGRIASRDDAVKPGDEAGRSLGLFGFRAPTPEPHPRRHGLRRRALPPRALPLGPPARARRGSSARRSSPYEAGGVRYLGSTIVLGDEACYCHFEGPTEAAVAEANRRAGLPFDRIVPAVTVTPKGEQR